MVTDVAFQHARAVFRPHAVRRRRARNGECQRLSKLAISQLDVDCRFLRQVHHAAPVIDLEQKPKTAMTDILRRSFHHEHRHRRDPIRDALAVDLREIRKPVREKRAALRVEGNESLALRFDEERQTPSRRQPVARHSGMSIDSHRQDLLQSIPSSSLPMSAGIRLRNAAMAASKLALLAWRYDQRSFSAVRKVSSALTASLRWTTTDSVFV
jgi:hypothetical protein